MKKAPRMQTRPACAYAPLLWKYCQDPALGVWVAACEPLNLTVQASSYPELLGCLGEAMAAVLSNRSDRAPADGDFPVTTIRVSAEEMMPQPGRGFVAGNR